MTIFFADVRITLDAQSENFHIVGLELGAADMPQALALLMAWKAGLAIHPRFDALMEESLSSTKKRGTNYMTLREASRWLRDNVFA